MLRMRQTLIADSAAAAFGTVLGLRRSPARECGRHQRQRRTGLTSATVGVLFLLALFLSPLAKSIPSYATAPALLYVACLMARGPVDIEWPDITESAPAV